MSRLELKLMFELAARVHRLEAPGEHDRLRSNFVCRIKHLPLRLIPRRSVELAADTTVQQTGGFAA